MSVFLVSREVTSQEIGEVHIQGLRGLLYLRDFVRAMLTDIDGEIYKLTHSNFVSQLVLRQNFPNITFGKF